MRLLLILAILAGCATTAPAPIVEPKKVWCENNSMPQGDLKANDRASKEWLVAYWMRGERWCGWKP